MASPMGWFRRNQKGMLVVFGVLLMASFGLASVMTSFTETAPSDSTWNDPVVSYSGGTLTRGDMTNLGQRHFMTVRFLTLLAEAQQKARGTSFSPKAGMIDRINPGDSPDRMNREILDRILVLERAEQIGMRVSNRAVMDYLRNFADDQSLTETDMDRFCMDALQNVDFVVIREQLKRELAYQQMARNFDVGVGGIPTITQSWQAFSRLERKRDCELIKFPVANYVSQVSGAPSSSEMRTLFEEGKYDYPDPARKEPGFKRPRQVAATMLTASYTDFLEREKLKITPEQVQEEYDKLVAMNSPLVIELIPQDEGNDDSGVDNFSGDDQPPTLDVEGDSDGDSDGGAADTMNDASGDGTAEPGESGDGDGDGDGEGAGDGAGEGTDGDGESGDSSPNNESGESTSEATPTENEAGDPEADEDGNERAEWRTVLPAQYVSTLKPVQEGDPQEGETQEGDDLDMAPAGQESQPQEETTPQEETMPQEGTTPQEGTETEPSDGGQTEPNDLDLPDAVQPDPMPQTGDGLEIQDDTPLTRVKPQDEKLSNTIRSRLAVSPTMAEIEIAVNEANQRIVEYGVDFETWRDTQDLPSDQREPKPEPIDLDALCKEFHLIKTEQELIPENEFVDSEIGSINVRMIQNTFMGPREVPASLAQVLFSEFHELRPWHPETYVRYAGTEDRLIAYITEKKDPYVPEFSDAREEIEGFWKWQKAVDLAREDAKAMADDSNASQRALSVIDPANVKKTGDFAWYTQTGQFPALPDGVKPGEEFMETAFSLNLEQAGIALDRTRDNVYVVRPIKIDSRPDEEIEELFFNALAVNQGPGQFMRGVHSSEMSEMYVEFLKELYDEFDVRWISQ